ncbi:protein NUF1, putative [Entamoeba invadens IP1]|uniref:protein NUF1, putative n=1 Tax=Entamoeba invadens IP1 TaxID=370355 RepID=UPI0002C3F22B|nr:protein NUF1, putative [Entamoeba invadens IP1]ELP93450.1 protein NUF1, putative [Entamoeba invadens IP1]|eukprot:XP_004260221.1 protein NUF1, putative [Entamoeba invadens IP1]
MESYRAIQTYAMVQWVNHEQSTTFTDFSSLTPELLLRFLEKISATKCHVPFPKMQRTPFQRLETSNALLQFSKELGLFLTCSAEDINKKDEKTLLTFFTTAAQKFLGLRRNAMSDVIEWVESVTGWRCQNFLNEWSDGMVVMLIAGENNPLFTLETIGVVKVFTKVENVGVDELTTMMLAKRMFEMKNEITAFRQASQIDFDALRLKFDKERDLLMKDEILGIRKPRKSLCIVQSPLRKSKRGSGLREEKLNSEKRESLKNTLKIENTIKNENEENEFDLNFDAQTVSIEVSIKNGRRFEEIKNINKNEINQKTIKKDEVKIENEKIEQDRMTEKKSSDDDEFPITVYQAHKDGVQEKNKEPVTQKKETNQVETEPKIENKQEITNEVAMKLPQPLTIEKHDLLIPQKEIQEENNKGVDSKKINEVNHCVPPELFLKQTQNSAAEETENEEKKPENTTPPLCIKPSGSPLLEEQKVEELVETKSQEEVTEVENKVDDLLPKNHNKSILNQNEKVEIKIQETVVSPQLKVVELEQSKPEIKPPESPNSEEEFQIEKIKEQLSKMEKLIFEKNELSILIIETAQQLDQCKKHRVELEMERLGIEKVKTEKRRMTEENIRNQTKGDQQDLDSQNDNTKTLENSNQTTPIQTQIDAEKQYQEKINQFMVAKQKAEPISEGGILVVGKSCSKQENQRLELIQIRLAKEMYDRKQREKNESNKTPKIESDEDNIQCVLGSNVINQKEEKTPVEDQNNIQNNFVEVEASKDNKIQSIDLSTNSQSSHDEKEDKTDDNQIKTPELEVSNGLKPLQKVAKNDERQEESVAPTKDTNEKHGRLNLSSESISTDMSSSPVISTPRYGKDFLFQPKEGTTSTIGTPAKNLQLSEKIESPKEDDETEEQKRIRAREKMEKERLAKLAQAKKKKHDTIDQEKTKNVPFVLDGENIVRSSSDVILDYFKETLCEWVGKRNFNVILDEKFANLTTNRINETICLKGNLMIIAITTSGFVFGSYNSMTFPIAPKKRYSYLNNDQNFFIFSLFNRNHDEPQRFKRKKNGKTVCVWSEGDKKTMFSVKRFYRIHKTGRSEILKKFVLEYQNVPETKHLYFTGEGTFDLSRLVVLRWE